MGLEIPDEALEPCLGPGPDTVRWHDASLDPFQIAELDHERLMLGLQIRRAPTAELSFHREPDPESKWESRAGRFHRLQDKIDDILSGVGSSRLL